ncbi:hypothetical protein FLLO111716_09005 [Flavobacterium longum]|uniref:T9SS type A sorting domain-containing protein n=1 Tax=Flavobacterium longum TaxID=1299340 RepID=UPI0039EBC27F
MKKIFSFLFFFAGWSLAAQPQTQAQANSGSFSQNTSNTSTFIVGTIYVKYQNISGRMEQPVVVNDVLFTPNPVKDYLSFTKNSDIKSIRIFDLGGRQMIEAQVRDNMVNLSALPKGCYVMITDTDSSKGYKLFKE